MELIDTHCHLTGLNAADLRQTLVESLEANVQQLICIGAGDGLNSAAAAVALTKEHQGVFATVGVHPHDARLTTQVDALDAFATDPRVVAIGETGLDFFRDWAPADAQFDLFRNSIRLAVRARKPLVIHCREAQDETINTLREEGADAVGGVFHCYSGDSIFAEQLRELRFLVSFTGNITFKKSYALQEAVRLIPLEQIMLETDMPYMAPEPFRGKRSAPKHVALVASKVAELKGITVEEVAARTTENARKLFTLPPEQLRPSPAA